MTRGRGHQHRARKRGVLSGLGKSAGHGGRAPLWQWFVGIPILVILVAMIAGYVFITFLRPDLARAIRTVETVALERVEALLPDGRPDPQASWILVRVDGRELRLPPTSEDWNRVAPGDSLRIDLEADPTGTMRPLSWRLSRTEPVAPLGATPPAASPGPAPPGQPSQSTPSPAPDEP